MSREIIPPALAVRAMRDSGYKNTAYALAEIIDNSVQADATLVEAICVESAVEVNQRVRRRISAIGILDNGHGMPPETLWIALQFGNGTRLNNRRGIGRFGMGLPNSSISQCRRLDVWTWENGITNAVHSYLDVNDIENSLLFVVPKPEHRSIPNEWLDRSDNFGTSGTLVVWSELDDHRLTWRSSQATLRNTEVIVGRMYRKFIGGEKRLSIKLRSFYDGQQTQNDEVRVNDPLYLMSNSSTPEPFNETPMFESWGETNNDEIFEIDYDGEIHKVSVRISLARQDTVKHAASNRGNEPYGKHAAKNIGVSIVREGRELDLDPAWVNSYQPTERWWGVEVEFPSALDEIFGVTNSKQSATIFSSMAQFDWKAEAEANETAQQFRERLQIDGDPRSLLLPIVEHIRTQLPDVRDALKKQTAGTRTIADPRHDVVRGIEDHVTSKFEERARLGFSADVDDVNFTEEDSKKFEKDLQTDKKYPESVAEKIARATFLNKRKVAFVTKAWDGHAFFEVEKSHGGLTVITFNTRHPFHDQLKAVLDPELGSNETDKDLLERIHRAADTLECLFAAWARYEIEESRHFSHLFDMRQDWGKMARFFLTEE